VFGDGVLFSALMFTATVTMLARLTYVTLPVETLLYVISWDTDYHVAKVAFFHDDDPGAW
jgi:hypothetical protein